MSDHNNKIANLSPEQHRQLSLLSAEDIENLPEDEIDLILDAFGLADAEFAPPTLQQLGLACEPSNDSCERGTPGIAWQPSESWLVRRPETANQAFERLTRHGQVIISGAHGSGKSHFWRRDLYKSEQFRALARVAIVIDCHALRMQSSDLLERDAVFALFGSDETALRAFVEDIGPKAKPGNDQSKSANGSSWLRHFIRTKLKRWPGLVVLDHLECLSSREAISKWLRDFSAWLRKEGIPLVAISADEGVDRVAKALLANSPTAPGGTDLAVRLDCISLVDLDAWWSKPEFAAFRSAGVTSRQIHMATGGWPRLVRDFGRFVQQVSTDAKGSCRPEDLVSAFKTASVDAYCPEIDRLMEVVRRHPALLHNILVYTGKNFVRDVIAQRIHTGAIRMVDDRLEFVSPIFARRFDELTTKSRYTKLFQSLDRIHIPEPTNGQELITSRLTDKLLRETDPMRAITLACEALRSWKLGQCRAFVRDPVNSKLWTLAYEFRAPNRIGLNRHRSGDAFTADASQRMAEPYATSGTWPLYVDERPDFALAVHSGRIVQRGRGTLYLPIIGVSGHVDAVIEGELDDLDWIRTPFNSRHRLRSLWNAVQTLQPVFAISIERLSSRTSFRSRRKSAYRLRERNDQPDRSGSKGFQLRLLDDILKDAGCSAIVLFEKSAIGWEIANFTQDPKSRISLKLKVVGNDPSRSELSWADVLSCVLDRKLDRIANHPSNRGLVLDGSDLELTFPRISQVDMRPYVYLHPVRDYAKAVTKMVAFVFSGHAARDIHGEEVARLSIIAELARHAA